MNMRFFSVTRAFALGLVATAAVGFACDPNSNTQLLGGNHAATDAGADGASGPVAPAGLSDRRIRRLTRDEYANTLKDLVGTQKDYGVTMPADRVVHDFDGNADVLEVDSLFADQARMNAEEIAAAFDLNQVGCNASLGVDCATSFVRSFGARALRRPVTDDEATRYAALYSTIAGASGFDAGVRTIVQAMLQSPAFLYRTELGVEASDSFELTPYEIASELSYLFWRSMPDAELLQHAASGDLKTPSVVASQVVRLLASPRANTMLDAFVDQWLYVGQLGQTQKDAATYPTWNDGVRNDMAGEAHAFFENVARDPQGSLPALLTASYSYVTPQLAQLYGVQGQGSGSFVRTEMGSDRGGLLTLGSVLALEATPTAANPVRRGKLVRVRLLCQDMPPPPPGVAGKIAPLDPNAPNRQKFTQHDSDPACSGCHKLLDPIGFGFEKFDGIGRLLPGTIDTTGAIEGSMSSDTTFDGVRDLEAKLAQSADVRSCFVRQWVRFGLGLSDTDSSAAEIDRLAKIFAASGATVQSLLAAMTQAPYVFRRNKEVIPAP
jgi:hypothetical protein